MTEQEVWDKVWSKLILNKNGEVDITMLKQHLYEYWWLIEQTSLVYTAITSGTITTANHSADEVVQATVDFFNYLLEYVRESDRKKIREVSELNNKLLENLVR